MDEDSVVSIKTEQKYIEQKKTLKSISMFVKSNFAFLLKAITSLEKQGLLLANSV